MQYILLPVDSTIVFCIVALKSAISVWGMKLGMLILQTFYTREHQETVKQRNKKGRYHSEANAIGKSLPHRSQSRYKR